MLHAKLGEISGQNCVHGQTDGPGGGGGGGSIKRF